VISNRVEEKKERERETNLRGSTESAPKYEDNDRDVHDDLSANEIGETAVLEEKIGGEEERVESAKTVEDSSRTLFGARNLHRVLMLL